MCFYVGEGIKTLNQKLMLYWAAKLHETTDAAGISFLKVISFYPLEAGIFLQRTDMLKKKNVG